MAITRAQTELMLRQLFAARFGTQDAEDMVDSILDSTNTNSLSELTVTSGNLTVASGDIIATLGDLIVTAGNLTAGGTLTGGTGVAMTYVDRGDPSAVDFTQASLTMTDTTYRDLDLSSAGVPGNALAHVRMRISYSPAGFASLALRKNGNSNAHNAMLATSPGGGVAGEADGFVSVDENGLVEYSATANLNVVQITVRGWWTPA